MTYVFLAGIGNSEPGHWQSLWYRSLAGAARWVEHADWAHPEATAWVADLDRALKAMRGPKLLVAHSVGCLLAVEWAKRHRDPDVLGSFLVAPPDVLGPDFPREAVGFDPPAAARQPPTPALVVASSNDSYASVAWARAAAEAWSADIVDVGALGHINLASEIGAWDEGRRLLERFVARIGKL
jgi:uncharacterized protein